MVGVAVVLLLASAQDVEVAVGADAFFLKTTGTLKFDERPGVSDRLDLEDDLGHHRPEYHFGVHATLSGGRHRGQVGYERWRSSWHHTLEEPLDFDGALFPAGERVRNRFAIDRWKTRYDFGVVGGQAGALRVGIRGDYWQFEHVMDSVSTGRVDDHLGTFVVEPALMAMVGPFGGLRVEAEAAGIYYRFLRHTFRTFEAGVSLRWAPVERFEVSAGFRVSRQWFINQDSMQHNEIDLSSAGPMASVDVRF